MLNRTLQPQEDCATTQEKMFGEFGRSTDPVPVAFVEAA
jgi:hypothetical protein